MVTPLTYYNILRQYSQVDYSDLSGTPPPGNVSGPGSSVAGDYAVFADTSGAVIKDGGSPWVTHGQVRFENDGSAHGAVLYPFNGNGLWVFNPVTSAWQLDAIPSGDLTSGGIKIDITNCNIELNAGQPAVSNTFYYAYYTRNVIGSVGTPNINLSVNGYGVNGVGINTTPGPSIYIKNGDVTQTLVGVLYPLSGSIAGTGSNQLVLSWFNRIKTRLFATISGSTSATVTYATMTGGCNFVIVDDQAPDATLTAVVSNSGSAQNSILGIGQDGGTTPGGIVSTVFSNTPSAATPLVATAAGFAGTGIHSAQALALVSGSTMTISTAAIIISNYES